VVKTCTEYALIASFLQPKFDSFFHLGIIINGAFNSSTLDNQVCPYFHNIAWVTEATLRKWNVIDMAILSQ
jgi:hypothetical protein